MYIWSHIDLYTNLTPQNTGVAGLNPLPRLQWKKSYDTEKLGFKLELYYFKLKHPFLTQKAVNKFQNQPPKSYSCN